MYAIADSKAPTSAISRPRFFRSLKMGLIMGGLNLLFGVALAVALPFYLGQKATWAVFAGGVLFWTMILAMLILQYVPAIFARDEGTPRQALKTALYLFVDNPFFDILADMENLHLRDIRSDHAARAGTRGHRAGIGGRGQLRMKKYRYLKENPRPTADRSLGMTFFRKRKNWSGSGRSKG